MLSWADSLERARQQWSRPKSTHLHIDSSSCNMASALTAHVSSRVTPSPAVQPAVSAVAHPPATPLQESVLASVTYTQPRPDGEQLFTSVARPSSGQQANNLVPDPKIVKINDIRTSQRRFSLQSNGFQLEPLPLDAAIDWDSSDEVQALYYPEVEQLIKSVAGATRVHIFDHTIRRGRASRTGTGSNGTGSSATKREPVSRVHVDYDLISGPHRLHEVMAEEEAAALSKTPFAIIQVWRPLKGPVLEAPLAMIDAATVSKDDYMPLRIEFESRTGHNFALKYSPAHQWFYAKHMQAEEAYVFKCYDSRNGRARFTPHTGFSDPTTPADAPPRESIEIRAYAFWENEPEQAIAREL